MSAYSQESKRRGSKSSTSSNAKGKSKIKDPNPDQRSSGDENENENRGLLVEYEELLPHPSQNFKPRPYHIAIVSCLAALGNGIPLPTVFSLYQNVMCGIVGDKGEKISSLALLSSEGKNGFWSILFPPSPELPLPAKCPTSEVASLTSFYSSALAVTGALLSLLLLQLLTNLTTNNSTSTLGFKFKKLGRKPPLIFAHFFLSITYLLCAIFPLIFFPNHPILTAVTLGLSRVLADANNGSPLMLLTQNYVFDTTDENHHASSLAFVDGFAQIGSFPSAAIGGWIAALTKSFWSPFYSAATVLAIASVYIMTCVPESRKGFREGVGKEEEEEETAAEVEQDDGQNEGSGANGSSKKRLSENSSTPDRNEEDQEASGANSNFNPTSPSKANVSKKNHHKYSPVRLLSFLSPLLLFLPVSLPNVSSTSTESNTLSRRKRLRSLLLPPLLFLLSLLEACYNVFILPALLLFNTDILNLSVIQNGLVVSGLQAVRGIWLIAIWPRLLHWRRSRSSNGNESEDEQQDQTRIQGQNRNQSLPQGPKRPNPMIRTSYGSTSFEPHTPLPDERSSKENIKKSKSQNSGDLIPLMFSYVQATIGFMILSSSRSKIWSSSLIPIIIGTWVLETGSGSHSCRTSLIVKSVGEIITEKRELESDIDQDENLDNENRGKNSEQIKADLETSLLSALQLLATLTLSSIPVLTSAVYSWGLKIDLPESAWILKAICSFGSLFLAGLVWWVDGW